MRVLVVDEEIPYPLNSGKRLRTYNLLKPLASRHEITFLCRRHEQFTESQARAMEDVGIRTIVVPHPIRKKSGVAFYLSLFGNLFSRYPYSVCSHRSRPLVESIQKLTEEFRYDLIHCEWTPYAINLQHSFGTLPTLVDAHNIEAMIWQRNCQVERNILKKYYIYVQWKKMASFEKRFFPKFTRCVAVSEQDGQLITQQVGPDRVDVVANGVDVTYFQRQQPLCVDMAPKKQLVFTGSLDWRPNVDGLLYFLNSVFPLIQQRVPSCTLTIVGRNPMPALRSAVIGRADISLTGTVEDVRPYMEAAAVYIVPLRIAGGSRLKILEALSMEMPVVSTIIGAEGLDVTHGQDILLADAPEAFAATVVALLKDRQKAEDLGKQGRSLVVGKYQWHLLADRLERNWHEAVASWQKRS